MGRPPYVVQRCRLAHFCLEVTTMFRRATSLLTLSAFVLSLVSCGPSTRVFTSPDEVRRSGTQVNVKAIITTSIERAEFSHAIPARVDGDRLVWNARPQVRTSDSDTRPSVRLPAPALARVNAPPPGVTRTLTFVTSGGIEYSGDLTSQKNGSATLRVTSFAVSLSQVEHVLIEKREGGKTFRLVVGVVAVVGLALAVAYLIAVATKESCPFVYSYDGDTYILDGEPYSGATSPGLKRTEWSGLSHLADVGGEYRLKLTNEVDETQYTDELKLVVVDGPRGVSVVADESGAVHGVAAPLPPSKAVDAAGRDILPYVGEDDWVTWQSAGRALALDGTSATKERLVFEFPKPAGATRARLVFDGGNTLWASQMVKRFLALHGRALDQYYASLSAPGLARVGLDAWNLREELYRMHIRVLTNKGWEARGSVLGGGPFVTRARLYSFDVSDVAGDVLTIALTPAVGFWTINHLAVDYGADPPLTVREIEADRAVDSHGTNLRPLLASTDSRYVVMPTTGDSADLVFKAPPPPARGLMRSVILKASGYYDIHFGDLGEPQTAVLAKVRAEPGFAVRYAMDQYRAWQATVAAEAAR